MYSKNIFVDFKNLYRVNKLVNESYLLKNGDILFVRSSLKREGVGWAAMVRDIKEPLTFCGFIIKCNLNNDEVYPEFLTYYLRTNSARNNLISASGKVTITNINQGMLGEICVPVPPLMEQKNIIYILSTIQFALEEAENVLDYLQKFKRSVMNYLFSYGNTVFKESAQKSMRETEIGIFPSDWQIKAIGEVCDLKSGGTPSTSIQEYWQNGTIPWVKSGQCQNCLVSKTETFITKEGLDNSSAKMLEANTALVAMVGATIGKTGFLTFKACTNQNIAALIPKKDSKVDNRYLFYSLQSRYEEFTKLGGFVIANLSFIRNLKIPVPSIEEQKEIALALSLIDNEIDVEAKNKEALTALLNSMLFNLMTAKIRAKDLRTQSIDE
jgi:type I restriction enzyme S subunit